MTTTNNTRAAADMTAAALELCDSCKARPAGHGHFGLYCAPCADLPYGEAAPADAATCPGADWIDGVWTDAHTYVDRPGTEYTDSQGVRRMWQHCSTCHNGAVNNRPLTRDELAAEMAGPNDGAPAMTGHSVEQLQAAVRYAGWAPAVARKQADELAAGTHAMAAHVTGDDRTATVARMRAAADMAAARGEAAQAELDRREAADLAKGARLYDQHGRVTGRLAPRR